MEHLADLAVFARVAELKSFTAAAERLGLDRLIAPCIVVTMAPSKPTNGGTTMKTIRHQAGIAALALGVLHYATAEPQGG